MGDGCMVGSHALRSLGFDAHLIGIDSQEFRDASLNLGAVGADLGLIQDQRGIDIGDRVTRPADLLQRFLYKDGGISTLPFGVGGWKVSADVARSHRPQQRVRQSVQQDVTIGMSGESLVMRNIHAADL